MSQMYEVSFQAHFVNLVDIGKVIVCAPSQEAASDMAMQLLELPRSSTRCEVRRIKPSIWQLERREISKHDDRPRRNGRPPPPVSPYRKYHLQVDAVISARSENVVFRIVGQSLIDRVSGRRTGESLHARDIVVDCMPLSESARAVGTMERIETYRHRSWEKR